MNLRKCRPVMIVICAALCVAWLPVGLEAKVWLNGHIVELRPDGFVLQTRFYPHITVDIAGDTVIRCKKRVLNAKDLVADDLVTVEGRDRQVEACSISGAASVEDRRRILFHKSRRHECGRTFFGWIVSLRI